MNIKNPGHILITGASSGIGRALALIYAAPGVRLSLHGRSEARLREVGALCAAKGAQVHYILADVTQREQIAREILAADVARPVDLLIANAGISGGTGGVMNGEPADQVRAIFDVNVTGVFNTTEPLMSRMIARGGGQIALMASLAGFRGWPGAPAYCASKAAVKVYGEGLRGALRRTGVRVSVICPGFVESPMTAANGYRMPFLMSAERAAHIIRRGLARDRGRIAFPLPSLFFAWLFSVLPDNLMQGLLARTPGKPSCNIDNNV